MLAWTGGGESEDRSVTKKIVSCSDVHEKETCQKGTLVFLDGVDISSRCYRAEIYDDGSGAVYCYRRSHTGGVYLGADGEPANERLAGNVEIVRPGEPVAFILALSDDFMKSIDSVVDHATFAAESGTMTPEQAREFAEEEIIRLARAGLTIRRK